MKIAILGAPGSGKSKLAKKTFALLKEIDPDWTIVDGYVDQLSKRTGIPFGAESNFPHNLTVITERWVKEAEAYNKNLSTITCGSIYESILYSTFATMFNSPDEGQMMRDQIFNSVMMQTLGALENTTYYYDAMFLLPLEGTSLKNAEGTWNQVVDAKLPEVLDAFQKKAILLDQKTISAKAETIVQVVEKVKEFYGSLITEDDEPAV